MDYLLIYNKTANFAFVKQVVCRIVFTLVMMAWFIPATSQRNFQDFIGADRSYPDSLLFLDSLQVDSLPTGIGISASPRYGTTRSIPTTYSISTDSCVGEIPCSSTISQYGSTELNVGIECFEDPLGCTPHVSLAYSSLNGNGSLGYGWRLSGLSFISRISKSIYYDDETSAATGGIDDAFSLDGIRLIKTGETTDSIYYQTETGNIKAQARLFYGGTLSSFKVFYPNGDIAVYGTRDAMGYYITSLSTRAKSQASFSYELHGNHYRIKTISYGKALAGKITFQYTSNQSDGYPVFYQSGTKVSYDYLLSSVSTSYNNSELRKYTIGYETNGSVRQISSIGCQSGGESLNPLHFIYGEQGIYTSLQQESSQLTKWYRYSAPGQVYVTRGKFDYGNDNDGLLMFPNKVSYYERMIPIRRIINNYSTSDSLVIATRLYSDYSDWNPNYSVDDGFVDAFFIDLDDFPGDEIVKVNHLKSGSSELLQFRVFTSSSIFSVVTKYTRQFSLTGLHNSQIIPKYFFTGDFNGDGRMEIMAVTSSSLLGSNLGSQCFILDLEGNAILYSGSPFSYNVTLCGDSHNAQDAYNLSDKLLVMDYDGDGKSDIAIVKDDSTYVYSFSVQGTTWACSLKGTCSLLKNSTVENRNLLVGEFNGDGKHDILVSPLQDQGSTWSVYASRGNAQFDKKDLTVTTKDSNSQFFLQDMDLDGQSDLVKKTANVMYIHTISNLTTGTSYSDCFAATSTNIIIPANILSGNNWYSLLSINENGNLKRLRMPIDHSIDRLLHGSVSSLGMVKEFRYAKTNSGYSSVYNPGADAYFPYRNYTGALPVCSEMLSYYQGNTLTDIRMHYDNAVVHLQGRGFCGFSQVSSSDYVAGTYAYKSYDPYSFQCMVEDDNHLAHYEYTYETMVADNKLAQVLVSQKDYTDKTNGVHATTDYVYDAYGNMTQADVDFGDGNYSHLARTYRNTDNGWDYYLGQILTEQQTTVRGSESFTNSVTNTYNGNGLVVSTERKANGLRVSKEDYTYNTDNLITAKILRKYSSTNPVQNTFTYNANGQVATRTDAFGFTETMSYNNRGLLSSVTDHLGNSVSTCYDKWDRQTKVVHPDLTTDSTAYEWGLYQTTLSAIALRHISTGKPSVLTYYDVLGNKVLRKTANLNGNWLTTSMEYDARQRLSRVSYPYMSSSEIQWMTYTYDNYDRIRNLQYADGSADSYSYSGLTKTVTKKGLTTTYHYNAIGDIVSVTDAGGTVAYVYNGEGNPLSITAPGNITTTITYDGYGRRTSLTDPSAGTSTTEYDTAGNVCRTVDARGKETLCTYDQYDRMVSRQMTGESTTTYSYDANNHLTGKTSTNGTSAVYTYDQLERLSSERENSLDGIWLKREYTYSDGNLSSAAYSCNGGAITTEQYSYQNGHLKQITTSDNKTIYYKIAENYLGLDINYYTGYISHTLDYDVEGRLTSQQDTYLSNVRQSLTYQYDATTGNLISRTDVKRNLAEGFQYDQLDRLTHYGNEQTVYDEKGNIVRNSLVGEYTYDASRPYAVSDIYYDYSMMPTEAQNLTFNALGRVATLSQGSKTATFWYDYDGRRTKMTYSGANGSGSYTKHYVGTKYETITQDGTTRQILYLGGDAYSAPAAYVRDGNGAWALYCICRDHQGSITVITNETGNIVQELSYDAWGNLRSPETHEVYAIGEAPVLFLGRGYTGHEHLTEFGLINMNARLYDPMLGRFISPDPYVQASLFSQGYNRYSYCLNNPLSHTDLSGKFFIETWFTAITDGIINVATHGFNVSQYNWDRTIYAWKIDSAPFKGGFGNIMLNMTWGLPNTNIGNKTAHFLNIIGKVDGVSEMEGLTAIGGITSAGRAFTIGPYSFGPDNYKATWKDHLFVHEYGHFIQHKLLGPTYIPTIAIPSLASAAGIDGGVNHRNRWFEVDASRRGAAYFDEHYGSGKSGYVKGSPDYFDIYSFSISGSSPYINPRTGISDQNRFPITSSHYIFWDYYIPHILHQEFSSLLLNTVL